ncbi:hypothetical protein PGIGA_G00252780 [Pangasianodon gigas]|uniref:Uncharacterized protein n=1 Tax=Pangasianodon gigas TaxID=30993 RepID=A0ACC5WR06_PANGG|nr:hypothetical protein [Pangasianodon gigas]
MEQEQHFQTLLQAQVENLQVLQCLVQLTASSAAHSHSPSSSETRAKDGCAKDVVDLVVLEQFITRLPQGMAEWVQSHHPVSLNEPSPSPCTAETILGFPYSPCACALCCTSAGNS